jgi:hypothetical protein
MCDTIIIQKNQSAKISFRTQFSKFFKHFVLKNTNLQMRCIETTAIHVQIFTKYFMLRYFQNKPYLCRT